MAVAESEHIAKRIDRYLDGLGADVGCGAKKVCSTAIGVDFRHQYAVPTHPETVANFQGSWLDALSDIAPGSLDYVFSSHLLEDFETPDLLLHLWTFLAAVKVGGYVILYLPIEEAFKAHCEATGQHYNDHHFQKWSGEAEFCSRLTGWFKRQTETVEADDDAGPYSFLVVFRKIACQ